MIIGLDVDGTLCHTPKGVNYGDPAELLQRCQPREEVLARVRAAAAAGHDLVVVTQRGPYCTPTTDLQLRAWLGDAYGRVRAVHHRLAPTFDIARYVPDKAHQIATEACDIYIGDRDEDRRAASLAGALFLWDHESHLLPDCEVIA